MSSRQARHASDPASFVREPLSVLVAAPFPSVRRGLITLLAEYDDLSPHPVETGAALIEPDVVVAYVSSGAIGAEFEDRWGNQVPIVYVIEGLLAELPEIADHPVALLPAEADGAALRAAVIAVSNGLSVIDTTFATSAGIVWRQPMSPTTAAGDQLTARELEVLNFVAQGWPNKTIASALGISEHTVKFHVGSILGKLGAESRTEAVTIATRRGMVVI
ncbi:MAG: response regulator transcription factor [Thermomicrobiales bacterium]